MLSKVTKQNVIACYISDAILGTFFQLPIWIVYQSQFLSFEQIAFYAGLALLVEVLMQLPTGAFADLFGRSLSLSLGNLFMAIPMFLIAFFPRPEIMFAYAIIWGIGRAFTMGTNKPMVYDSLIEDNEVEQFGSISSKSLVIFQVSGAISIALGGYLYLMHPTFPYIVSGVFSLIGVITSFLFIEPKIKRERFKLQPFIKKNAAGFVEIFKNSQIARLTILFSLLLGIANVNQQFFVQPYMLELGMSDLERSWVAMGIKIGIALIGAYVMSLKRISKSRYFLFVIPLIMIASLLPASVVTLPVAYMLFVGIAFTSGNTNLFFSPEYNRHIDSKVPSTAVSAQKMIASFVGAVVQWISAPIVAAQSVGVFYSYLGIFTLVILIPLTWSVFRQQTRSL